MKRLLAAAAALLLWPAAHASAEDVLVLTNGREARGKIVEETDAGVKLDVGAGRMTYPRSLIREIRRGSSGEKTPTPVAPPTVAEDARDDFALLYDDGRRVGTRSLRTAKTPGGFRFEEEVVLFDDKGAPSTQIHAAENCDAEFLPVSFQIRETRGGAEHTMSTGEIRGGRLYLTIVKDGDKTLRDAALPALDARFPLAARELFLRRSVQLGGKLDAKVYDAKDDLWRRTTYVESGGKPIEEGGRALTVRVVTRTRGDVVEREWLDERLGLHMAEMNGERLRAIGSSKDVVGRVKQGGDERALGAASAPCTRYVDAEGGWRIGKPDPSWTFEAPAVAGGGALLSVRNGPLFATIDVFKDPAAPPDDTLERAAESLQRTCRAVAPDFKAAQDGYVGEGPARFYWLVATATTKGEKTKTLARVLVRKTGTYRVLAACPEGAFDLLRPDLEKIVASFAAE